MNCSPTLTAEEFSSIHTALYSLEDVTLSLQEVIKPEVLQKLKKAKEDIRSALKNAYELDRRSFDQKYSHYRDVQEELGLKSIWSNYDVKNLADRHDFKGVERVVYKDHWGKRTVSSAVNGITWAALYVAADACIRDSGDNHHVFIEDFKQDNGDLILVTGS